MSTQDISIRKMELAEPAAPPAVAGGCEGCRQAQAIADAQVEAAQTRAAVFQGIALGSFLAAAVIVFAVVAWSYLGRDTGDAGEDEDG